MMIEGMIRTIHSRPDSVAASLRPDNLLDMATDVVNDAVLTTIRGKKIRSVIASVDDYLMNLSVAEELCKFGSR